MAKIMQSLIGLQVIYKHSCPEIGCNNDVSMHNLLIGRGCELHQSIKGRIDVNEVFSPWGVKPWGAQRMWIRRFLRGESFAMIAPTGSGKTTTAMLLALYSNKKYGKKSLILVPTATLAYQIETKLKSMNIYNSNIIGFHTLSNKPTLDDLQSADIIVTTSASLVRNRNLFNNVKVDIIFVDDVDGFLRRSKAIDVVFNMLDVDSYKIKTAEEIIKLRSKAKGNHYEEILQLQKSVRLEGKQIIVSGATQSARRTKRVKLLSELVGFDIGMKVIGTRNVEDVYVIPERSMYDTLLTLVKKLGKGALIFTQGSENVIKISEFLNNNGIKSAPYVKASKKLFRMFENGELDTLVGTATLRSSLVRGIDLPEAVRYVIFFGVPKYTIKVSLEEFTPARMLVVLGTIAKYLENSDKVKCGQIMDKLRKIINISRTELDRIKKEEEKERSSFLNYAKNVMIEALKFYNEVTANPELRQKAGIVNNQLVFPDPLTYVQASGRSSRLTIKGMTKGLSILIVDEKRSFELLQEQLDILDIHFKSIDEIDLKQIIKEIDETRMLKAGAKIEMESILLVVESPTKSKTISHFFGRPMKRTVNSLITYEVMTPDKLIIVTATRGHFFDLDIEEKSFGAIYDNGNLTVYFKQTKEGAVEALRKLAQDVDKVLVATDPDAEGEKIAWDIRSMITPYNSNVKRIKYHEITRRAIEEALNNPEDFDINLLQAQILRRIEDAWIGLPLSLIVQREFKKRWLSAGRVQTPVLGWIVERTEDNKKHKVELLTLKLENNLTLPSIRMPRGSAKKLKDKGKIKVVSIKIEDKEINPPPPYTTDSMLTDATRELKTTSEEIMKLAQDLFEVGFITYHRTDATTVSAVGMNIAKQYLTKINKTELYVGRPWTSEGAHECIRPTRPLSADELELMVKSKLIPVQIPIGKRHIDLYDLIFRRFIASQMSSAIVRYITSVIEILDTKHEFKFAINVIKHGFDLINPIRLNDANFEQLKENTEYSIIDIKKRIVGEKSLFNEADLIRLMKEKRIGRPSTYAITIEKLKERGYIYKVKTGQLISLKLGEQVFKFLIEKFRILVDEDRTRKVLEAMDMVENGTLPFLDVVSSFYQEVQTIVEKEDILRHEKIEFAR
ncbi:MAG: reverse gyrase [Thermoprotei archaeon]|jgi:reverse gyrase